MRKIALTPDQMDELVALALYGEIFVTDSWSQGRKVAVRRCRRFNTAELGHGAGDDTLRVMADLLLKYSRGINVICRWGGDEFAVLLVETTKAGAQLYAERLRQVLAAYPFAQLFDERLTFIQAADEALYSAKRSGRNRVCMFEDIAAAPRVEPEVERV